MTAGVLMLMLGALLACLAPVHRALAWWRWQRTAAIGAVLRFAHPIATPDPTLERLIASADASLAQDHLIRGVAGVTQIYDRA